MRGSTWFRSKGYIPISMVSREYFPYRRQTVTTENEGKMEASTFRQHSGHSDAHRRQPGHRKPCFMTSPQWE